MAQMYFSKFNINSEIYRVYDDENLKDEILNEVFEKMNEVDICSDDEKDDNIDDGDVVFKFCDLKKNKKTRTICGRLVKIYRAELQSYDIVKDTVITNNADNCAASSTFYFDINREEIAFITRNALGYKQFNRYFKTLVDKFFDQISFEIILENNVGELTKKLNSMNRILSIESIIIPPNASSVAFDNIFGPSKEDVKNSGATKVITKMEVSNRGKSSLNIFTDYFKRIKLALKMGYASFIAKGKDKNNENCTVTSEKDAPYKVSIPNNEKDDLEYFSLRAEAEIDKLIEYKKSEDASEEI